MPGKANCCCLARMQHSVLCPRFHGEDGSEDLPVRFGAARAHWCGVGGQADAAVGADVVVAGESFPHHRGRLCRLRTDPRLFGFNIWFASLEWGREREPSGGCVRPGTMAAAAEVAGESPGACRPTGLRCGGCSYPWGRNRSSVCNGTLSAGVLFTVAIGA
jgi:hypothetical protein